MSLPFRVGRFSFFFFVGGGPGGKPGSACELPRPSDDVDVDADADADGDDDDDDDDVDVEHGHDDDDDDDADADADDVDVVDGDDDHDRDDDVDDVDDVDVVDDQRCGSALRLRASDGVELDIPSTHQSRSTSILEITSVWLLARVVGCWPSSKFIARQCENQMSCQGTLQRTSEILQVSEQAETEGSWVKSSTLPKFDWTLPFHAISIHFRVLWFMLN